MSERQDALPLFARWSTWLMWQLLRQGIMRAPTFVDAMLIENYWMQVCSSTKPVLSEVEEH